MNTLNINVIYSYKDNVKIGDLIEYKVYISYNENNQSIYIFNDYLFVRSYEHLIDESLQKVLNYLGKSEKDFSTIQYNSVNTNI
jgi:hypothetical protein